MAEYTFSARIVAFLGIDILLTVICAYIPHEIEPVRTMVSVFIFIFMAATTVIAARRVLQDF